jgi:cellulose biosynthesis protein BcsQ
MKIVGVYNIKGGVGKTTTAVNLACAAAHAGSALLWDLDPQGAAGYSLGIPETDDVGGTRDLLRGRSTLSTQVVASRIPQLDMIPARFAYRKLDILLHDAPHPRTVLRGLLRTLGAAYEWAFLDCPPGIGLVSENVFRTVDVLLVPVVPTPLSLRAFEEIIVFFHRKGYNRSRILAAFTMVERRRAIHKDTMAIFRAREASVCATVIPSLSDIERSTRTRRPVVHHRPASEAGRAYAMLWEEVSRFARRI